MKLIVAVNNKGVIGDKHTIPWKCKADLKHFKKLTGEGTVNMGRKTWESLPVKPLPNRLNVVISETLTHEDVNGGDYSVDAVTATVESVRFVEGLYNDEASWLIGGKSTYDALVDICTEIHISHINDDSDGDTTWSIPEDFKGQVYHYYFEVDGADTGKTKQVEGSVTP